MICEGECARARQQTAIAFVTFGFVLLSISKLQTQFQSQPSIEKVSCQEKGGSTQVNLLNCVVKCLQPRLMFTIVTCQQNSLWQTSNTMCLNRPCCKTENDTHCLKAKWLRLSASPLMRMRSMTSSQEQAALQTTLKWFGHSSSLKCWSGFLVILSELCLGAVHNVCRPRPTTSGD